MSSVLRHWSLVAIVVLMGGSRSFADAMSDGDAAFAKGDYPAAVRAFETALAAQGPSAGLYYNLAMAQSRAGEAPQATLSLRRAILLDPRMTDARVALSDLERSQGVPAAPSGWKFRWRELLAEKISLQGLMVTGSILAWAGAFLLLFTIFRRGWKFWPVAASLALLFAGKGLFLAGFLADPRFAERDAAVVLAGEGASLRTAPADQSAVITKVPAGAGLFVLRRSGEWSYCQTPTGEKGWTSAKALGSVVPAA